METYPKNKRFKVTLEGKIYDTAKQKWSHTYVNDNGYELFILSSAGDCKSYRVHRAVMETYDTESEFYGLDVNHKDGNKLNNHRDNLEWCTRSHNIKHAIDTGLNPSIGSTHSNSILTDDQIHEICKLLERCVSNQVIAKEFNIDPSHVSHIKTGDLWKHITKDYKFTKYTNSKLSKESILDIHLRAREGEDLKDLMKQYEVSLSTVKRIRDKLVHKKIIEDSLNDHRRHNK